MISPQNKMQVSSALECYWQHQAIYVDNKGEYQYLKNGFFHLMLIISFAYEMIIWSLFYEVDIR